MPVETRSSGSQEFDELSQEGTISKLDVLIKSILAMNTADFRHEIDGHSFVAGPVMLIPPVRDSFDLLELTHQHKTIFTLGCLTLCHMLIPLVRDSFDLLELTQQHKTITLGCMALCHCLLLMNMADFRHKIDGHSFVGGPVINQPLTLIPLVRDFFDLLEWTQHKTTLGCMTLCHCLLLLDLRLRSRSHRVC